MTTAPFASVSSSNVTAGVAAIYVNVPLGLFPDLASNGSSGYAGIALPRVCRITNNGTATVYVRRIADITNPTASAAVVGDEAILPSTTINMTMGKATGISLISGTATQLCNVAWGNGVP